MRIPLDYYRILGVPIQATAQQLSQAYHDRALQLPRREYSDFAINARKQLLDEAYRVLSEPEKRSAYDGSFLAKSYEMENQGPLSLEKKDSGPPIPLLEIESEQFVGALLILQELGEYEQVLQLARPLLDKSQPLPPEQERLVNSKLVRADIVLTVALTCLELGREQWQQGQSEKAAISAQTGQELLLREGLFPNIRGEIQADLYKLRPYRVLELLSLDPTEIVQRRKGLYLLGEMLQERGGIDGNGDDRSGLGVDDFLRFVQQIRNYLTVAEQQELFESEARRPSAVATYLAVYALMARGFAQREPKAIARAKEMLARLGRRQDVNLEQAVCALLLGQTEEASQTVELSQEHEPLAFIREHSQESPDLLPGLCLYGERWLQTEVFPHFRDLVNQSASLKEYFADPQVQAYLEQMPETASSPQEWAVVESQAIPVGTTLQEDIRVGSYQGELASLGGLVGSNGSTATLSPPNPLSAPEREGDTPLTIGAPRSPRGRESGNVGRSRRQRRGRGRGSETLATPGRTSKSHLKIGRLVLVGAVGIGGLLVLGFAIAQVLKNVWGGPEAEITNTNVTPIVTPSSGTMTPSISPASPTTTATDKMDAELAQQIIQSWLSAKSAALGPEYRSDELKNILTEPILGDWRERSQEAKKNKTYQEFQHPTIKIESVKLSNSNSARVQASVQEVVKGYRNGKADKDTSYNANLRVQYEIVRQEQEWRIKNIKVLPK